MLVISPGCKGEVGTMAKEKTMSAINAFAFENILVLPRTCCECVPVVAEDVVPSSQVPVISPSWRVEIGSDVVRKLVQHWFKNEEHS